MFFKLCNKILSYNTLLNGEQEKAEQLQNSFTGILYEIIFALVAIVGASAAIWGIICAINMMRADNQEKRDSAKKRIIYTVAAVIVTVIFIVLLVFFRDKIESWFGDKPFKEQ